MKKLFPLKPSALTTCTLPVEGGTVTLTILMTPQGKRSQ
jgi:hypothetical protein